MQTEEPDNSGIRSRLLALYEARLKQMFPDEPAAAALLSFDAIEAAAVRSGDETARPLMPQALSEAMLLSKCTKQGRCKCGRHLQWSDKPRTLETVRGPVTVTRLHGYCRVCERGFFPSDQMIPLPEHPEALLQTDLARMDDIHVFGPMLRAEAERRGMAQAREVIGLSDAGHGLPAMWDEHFPSMEWIIDFSHTAGRQADAA